MPIRVVKDPEKKKSSSPRKRRSGNSAGGGANLAKFLPLILGMFRKNPKSLIIVIVVGVILYLVLGQGGCSGGIGGDDNGGIADKVRSLFTRGADLDPKEYEKASIYEPLADNTKNPLPEKISLLEYAPDRKNQGRQGSCVGWASSYAARTILYTQETGENPNRSRFSPSYLYNQIALKNCQGSYLIKAMETLKEDGDLPLSEFRYDENSCDRLPSNAQQREAAQYRIKGFQRLSENATGKVDLLSMKQHLAQGNPIVIGMMVGGSFMQPMKGESEWRANSDDDKMRGFGGHAMCVIGYDDYRFGSENGLGFQIMNSWGDDWGKDGVAWVRYDDFEYFTKEAYAMYPYSKQEEKVRNFSVNCNLVKYDQASEKQKDLVLEYTGGHTFKLDRPMKKGTTFKLEITNNIECYVYAFGMEEDKSSYMLFPYTKKHSPYCGITGTRLFPRDHSFQADNIGTKDYMAIVVSKQPLDYDDINNKINKSSASTYEGKMKDALGSLLHSNVRFKRGDRISFDTETDGKHVIMAVIEVEKN